MEAIINKKNWKIVKQFKSEKGLLMTLWDIGECQREGCEERVLCTKSHKKYCSGRCQYKASKE